MKVTFWILFCSFLCRTAIVVFPFQKKFLCRSTTFLKKIYWMKMQIMMFLLQAKNSRHMQKKMLQWLWPACNNLLLSRNLLPSFFQMCGLAASAREKCVWPVTWGCLLFFFYLIIAPIPLYLIPEWKAWRYKDWWRSGHRDQISRLSVLWLWTKLFSTTANVTSWCPAWSTFVHYKNCMVFEQWHIHSNEVHMIYLHFFLVHFRITDFFDVLPSCSASPVFPSSPASLDTVILNVHDNLWEQQQNDSDGYAPLNNLYLYWIAVCSCSSSLNCIVRLDLKWHKIVSGGNGNNDICRHTS